MYDAETFEVILRRMLERVAAKFDKREGAVIYDALAPAAVEFQNLYIALETVLSEVFPDTASREYLIKHCAERKIEPKAASAAKVTGRFTPANLELQLGSRFSHEDLNYVVTEKISDGLYYLQCETVGSVANNVTGQLIPIDYVPGLQTAEIIEVTIMGENEEDTESLRARFFGSLQAESFGGNKMDYENKIQSIPGVGAVKVYRGADWNGGSTVRCVITDSAHGVPTEELVDEVQTIIDPEMIAPDGFLSDENAYAVGSGQGDGLAPIGHFVTIMGAYNTVININTVLIYKSGYSWELVKTDVENAVDNYLHELNEQWSELDAIRVRISQLESRILNVNGILDIRDTMINGKGENLTVDKDSLVTRGTINA